MLDDLIAITSSDEFEDDVTVLFLSVEWHGYNLTLNVAIEGYEIPRQQWRLVCSNVRAARVDGRPAFSVQLTDSHPLLWLHTELQADLFFNGKPKNAHEALGRMASELNEMVGNWFAIFEFLNPAVWSPKGMLTASYGKSASGPLPIIERLRTILEQGGSECSILTHKPKFWNGVHWQENDVQLKALVMDRSFVVTSHVDAQRY